MPVNKRQFTAAILVAVLCLVTANYFVAFLTRHSLPRRFLAEIRQSTRASVAVVGNSLLVAGFDTGQFDRLVGFADPEAGAANLAINSSMPIEHLLYLHYALARGMHPRFVIYGFIGTQPSEPAILSNRELIGNRSVLYYLDPVYARRFYDLSLRDSIEFQVMRRVAMLADRSAVWAKVEHLRRWLAAQGMPPADVNRFGRAADFSILEGEQSSFAATADRASRAPLSPPVEEMLRIASQAGAQVLLVEMPMPSRHRQFFYDTDSWRRYRAHLRSIAASRGVTYVDASEWVRDDSKFLDQIHLNDAGAAVFTEKLAALLRNDLKNR